MFLVEFLLFCSIFVSFRVGNSLFGFSSKLIIICERKSEFLSKNTESLPLLFCNERQEPIVQGPSFVMSDTSNLLLLLFCKER